MLQVVPDQLEHLMKKQVLEPCLAEFDSGIQIIDDSRRSNCCNSDQIPIIGTVKGEVLIVSVNDSGHLIQTVQSLSLVIIHAPMKIEWGDAQGPQ